LARRSVCSVPECDVVRRARANRISRACCPPLGVLISGMASTTFGTAPIHVVGGGLAGSEAAWQLAERGHDVVVHEMRGVRGTPAHKTERLAELVCSNTFKSTETSNAHGLLKAEMRLLGSVVLWGADQARVPGGSALTVDRDVFSSAVNDRVSAHPRISVVRE